MTTLLRDQRSVSVGVTDTQLVGPNPRRVALVISPPAPVSTAPASNLLLLPSADMNVTGVKLTYTCPAGVLARMTNITYTLTAGGSIATTRLELVRAAVTTILQSLVANVNQGYDIALNPGDTIRLNCTAGSPGQVNDISMAVVQYPADPTRITISFGRVASLGDGINIAAGTQPFVLLGEHIGQGLKEEIHAIASSGTQLIGVLDVMEDCNCPSNDSGLPLLYKK